MGYGSRTRISTSRRHDYCRWQTQDRPYRKSLPYERRIGTMDPVGELPLPSESSLRSALVSRLNGMVNFDSESTACLVQGKLNLRDKIRGSTGAAETLSAVDESFLTIASGASRIFRSYRALRRGNLRASTRILLEGSRNGRRRVSAGPNKGSFEEGRIFTKGGDNYLEWTFGIMPTVRSITDSVNYLQTTNRVNRYYSGASRKWSEQIDNGSIIKNIGFSDYTLEVYTGATVNVENPNLALADSFGFLDPVRLGWELVPFSFVADWFIPIGDFLGSFSPLWGRELERSFTTSVLKDHTIKKRKHRYDPTRSSGYEFHGMVMKREPDVDVGLLERLHIMRFRSPPPPSP